MLRRFVGALFLLVVASSLAGVRADQPSSSDEFFEKQVRPILVDRCLKCHGEAKPKGGLRLTSRASLLEGGESGPAAVAGKPEESRIILAIRYVDDPQMPPKGKMSEKEIDTLTRWVAKGLPWPEEKPTVLGATSKGTPYRITEEQRRFWSFQPIRAVEPPRVNDSSWPNSDIDRFLLAAMEEKGLKPSIQADKRTLIRRATFDLIGLPPTPEEVADFLRDETPQSFDKVVDRLLASPQYGERWARHWLDLVRYADSRDARGVGGSDDIGEAYRYRDWVVKAMNRDLPYDRFIIEQIAGDLIPAPSKGEVNAEGLVATGLLTIGEWGTGDADKEKMMTDIVDDQIDVVSRAFLGLTVACARCHDHKFDPIPTEDYYSLAGIFFSTHILPEPGVKTGGSPLLRTPLISRAKIEEGERVKAKLVEVEATLKKTTDEAYSTYARSLAPETARYIVSAWDYQNRPSDRAGQTLRQFAVEKGLREDAIRRWIGFLGLGDAGRLMTKPVDNVLGAAGVHAWKGEADCPSLTVNTNDKELSLLTFKLPARSVSVHPGPRSSVAVAWKSPIAGTVRMEGGLTDADPNGGDGVAWSLVVRKGGVEQPLVSGEIPNGGKARFDQAEKAGSLARVEVRAGDSIQLVVSPKGEYSCDTTVIDLRIAQEGGGMAWNLAQDLSAEGQQKARGNPHADQLGHAETWLFTEVDRAGGTGRTASPLMTGWAETVREVAEGRRDYTAIEDRALAIQKAVEANDPKGPDAALIAEMTSPRNPFLPDVRDDSRYLSADERAGLDRLRAERDALKDSLPPPIPVALAAQEGGVPKSAHPGIGDTRIHIRGNYQRLGAVAPRRFPRIVAGEDQPTISEGSGRLQLARWIARADHPLTSRVMANRIWQYHFGEGLVRTPSNFGKLGQPPTNPDLLDFLARKFTESGWSMKAMHRAIMLSSAYRQSSAPTAEALRIDPENRLFGRMNRRRLESEAIRDSLLAVSGQLDPTQGGPSIRDLMSLRRTLYVMTIRSDRSSFGPLFDAADSTAMVDRRTISTVAPQSLFLLNHPFALAQAEALAKRTLAEPGLDDRTRIGRLYERIYGRPPVAEEIAVGLKLVERGEKLQAWESYCQVLLCANEFLYVD